MPTIHHSATSASASSGWDVPSFQKEEEPEPHHLLQMQEQGTFCQQMPGEKTRDGNQIGCSDYEESGHDEEGFLDERNNPKI